ncbi:MAG TPA: hypothetical protein VF810_02980 [Patescibacteria group bacterium]
MFLKKYGIFIAPAFLFLIFIFLLVFSYTITSQQTPTSTSSSSPTPISNTSLPYPNTGQGLGSQSESEEKNNMVIWTNSTLTDSDLADFNATKETLPDGSIQYSYSSDVANRPNIIIVKNGINVFQRTPFTDTPMSQNTNFYGQPDYVAKGSQFWGPNAVTYIYLSRGISLIGDLNKDQLFEQIIFQPGTLDQFIKNDIDIIGEPQKP